MPSRRSDGPCAARPSSSPVRPAASGGCSCAGSPTLGARVVVSGPVLGRERGAAPPNSCAAGHDAVWSRGDVTVADDVRALARTAVDAFGEIDVWINNAAYETPSMARVLDFDRRRSGSAPPQVNVLGTGRCTLAALERMLAQGHGTIVNVTGRGDDVRPTKFSAPYGASKAWMRAFTRTLRSEYAGSGVNLVGVQPGDHDDRAHGARPLPATAPRGREGRASARDASRASSATRRRWRPTSSSPSSRRRRARSARSCG